MVVRTGADQTGQTPVSGAAPRQINITARTLPTSRQAYAKRHTGTHSDSTSASYCNNTHTQLLYRFCNNLSTLSEDIESYNKQCTPTLAPIIFHYNRLFFSSLWHFTKRLFIQLQSCGRGCNQCSTEGRLEPRRLFIFAPLLKRRFQLRRY